jgi:hypothetical protein
LVDLSTPFVLPGDMAAGSSRPNIRPRLDVSEPGTAESIFALKKTRDEVVQKLKQRDENPFTPQWYAKHSQFPPTDAQGDSAWRSADWEGISKWVGIRSDPLRYDFRPDTSGVIYVYRNGGREERAVDARPRATRLAKMAGTAEQVRGGLSLGVYAAVPPTNEPVNTLLHLVLGKNGLVSGYLYDFAADSMQPLRGFLDKSTQRLAWQLGDTVAEAGLKNLTEDAARALSHRPDGWTRPWLLIRIPESALPGQAKKAKRGKQ